MSFVATAAMFKSGRSRFNAVEIARTLRINARTVYSHLERGLIESVARGHSGEPLFEQDQVDELDRLIKARRAAVHLVQADMPADSVVEVEESVPVTDFQEPLPSTISVADLAPLLGMEDTRTLAVMRDRFGAELVYRNDAPAFWREDAMSVLKIRDDNLEEFRKFIEWSSDITPKGLGDTTPSLSYPVPIMQGLANMLPDGKHECCDRTLHCVHINIDSGELCWPCVSGDDKHTRCRCISCEIKAVLEGYPDAMPTQALRVAAREQEKRQLEEEEKHILEVPEDTKLSTPVEEESDMTKQPDPNDVLDAHKGARHLGIVLSTFCYHVDRGRIPIHKDNSVKVRRTFLRRDLDAFKSRLSPSAGVPKHASRGISKKMGPAPATMTQTTPGLFNDSDKLNGLVRGVFQDAPTTSVSLAPGMPTPAQGIPEMPYSAAGVIVADYSKGVPMPDTAKTDPPILVYTQVDLSEMSMADINREFMPVEKAAELAKVPFDIFLKSLRVGDGPQWGVLDMFGATVTLVHRQSLVDALKEEEVIHKIATFHFTDYSKQTIRHLVKKMPDTSLADIVEMALRRLMRDVEEGKPQS